MIYKFKSKAAGDIIMMGPNGDAFLRVIGREPAPKGIIEPGATAAAIAAIELALAAAEAERAEAEAEAALHGETLLPAEGVGLRQRLWPMVEMLRRAGAAGEPIVWGV
ncbi:MAG: DUF1840 family protein [Burkholderiaceae bacterium]|nr:DUF1840 family protein [Burkholderiaceae bacterium]